MTPLEAIYLAPLPKYPAEVDLHLRAGRRLDDHRIAFGRPRNSVSAIARSASDKQRAVGRSCAAQCAAYASASKR